jgi:hypothetical protein
VKTRRSGIFQGRFALRAATIVEYRAIREVVLAAFHAVDLFSHGLD